VPGLAAKPIIDVLTVDITAEEDHLAPLLGDGYQLRVREPDERLRRREDRRHRWVQGTRPAIAPLAACSSAVVEAGNGLSCRGAGIGRSCGARAISSEPWGACDHQTMDTPVNGQLVAIPCSLTAGGVLVADFTTDEHSFVVGVAATALGYVTHLLLSKWPTKRQ
jgi:hypothetical protein